MFRDDAARLKGIVLGLLVTAMVGLWGCGDPQYAGVRAKPDSEVSFGWGRSVRIGAETEGTLKGLRTSNGTELDELTLKSSPATTMREGWVPAMQVYGQQQLNYNEIRKTEWAGLNQLAVTTWAGVNEALATVAPVATQYLAGRNLVKQAEAQRPALIEQLVRAGVAGQIDPIAAAVDLPADWQAEIQRRVQEELQRALGAASRPSAMHTEDRSLPADREMVIEERVAAYARANTPASLENDDPAHDGEAP